MINLTDEMSPADQQAWAWPTTLLSLGELVAQWLEGGRASQPGYVPNCGPDQETTETEGMVEALASLNRAGYVTHGSQPGFGGLGADGQRWDQRAAVSGFADDAMMHRLRRLAARWSHELAMIAHWRRQSFIGLSIMDRWTSLTEGVPREQDPADPVAATMTRGRVHTVFGSRLSRFDINETYAECNRHMRSVLIGGSWQVTVYVRRWGPTGSIGGPTVDLWAKLGASA